MSKTKVLAAVGMCLAAIFFNGCGAEEKNAPVIPEGEPIVNMDGVQSADEKEDLNTEAKEPDNTGSVNQNEEEGQEAGDGENQVNNDEPVSAGEQRSGVIEQVNAGDFIINKAYVDNIQDEKFGELDIMDFSPEEEKKELMSVSYSDATLFIVQTIKDGGNDVSQREGTASDLEIGRIVTIDGADNNGIFEAAKVVINIVI